MFYTSVRVINNDYTYDYWRNYAFLEILFVLDLCLTIVFPEFIWLMLPPCPIDKGKKRQIIANFFTVNHSSISLVGYVNSLLEQERNTFTNIIWIEIPTNGILISKNVLVACLSQWPICCLKNKYSLWWMAIPSGSILNNN